jgi:hypothetical protein
MAYMKDSKGRRLDSFEVEEKAFTAALKYMPVPGLLRGNSGYNARSYNQDSVTTDSQGNIYAVWVVSTGKIIVGKRAKLFGTWETFDTSTIAGAPLGTFVNEDSHNTISIIADSDDVIHVCGNMHGEAIKYIRASAPRSIAAWTAPGMVGTEEALCTYPRFALHPDGTLFFHYREGASGSGDTYLNKYSGGSWTRVAKLTDGKTTNENAYENRFIIDRAGTLHLSYTWRPGTAGDFNANNDLHYMRSTDKGVTWKSIGGATVTLPLLHADGTALILDTAATNSGIINQAGMDVDTQGRPHIAISMADAGDRNVHHIWWNGTAWVNEQITSLKNGMGWYSRPMRASIVCTDDGRTLIFYSSMLLQAGSVGVVAAKNSGTFRMVDVTDGALVDSPIALLDGKEAEVTIDQRALRDHGLIRMLLTACNGEQSQPTADKTALEYWHDDNWSGQWGGILTIDAAQVGSVSRREVALNRIRTVAQMTVPENQVITSSSQVQIPNVQPLITQPELRGKQVFVRMSGRGSVSAGGTILTLQCNEVQQNALGSAAGNRMFGSLPFPNTTTNLRSTPWMPLQYGPVNGADAFIRFFAAAAGGGTGSLSSAVLELGVMDGPVEY